jgi:hypothetical protein
MDTVLSLLISVGIIAFGRLDCRRHARRWLAFGLDAQRRIDQPLWVGSGSKNVTF